jgi:hypothetical protein
VNIRPYIALLILLASLNTNAQPQTVLDGTEKSFVVIGYSTSFQWPAVLQKMLDTHAKKKGIYHVHNAAVAGAPVAKWIGRTNTTDRENTFDKMANDFFSPATSIEEGPKPSVALMQQSLQWIYGDQAEGIRSSEDAERIEAGADAFFALAEMLQTLGVETIYIATHIYKHPMEPEIGNERLALDALIERGNNFIHKGPPLWQQTKDAYPSAFADDKLHPNALGARIMATAWYKTLAQDDARIGVIEMAKQGLFDKKAQAPARRPRTPLPFAQRDRDEDGFITQKEFPNYMHALFDQIDTNDDQRISPHEYDVYNGRAPQHEAPQQ